MKIIKTLKLNSQLSEQQLWKNLKKKKGVGGVGGGVIFWQQDKTIVGERERDDLRVVDSWCYCPCHDKAVCVHCWIIFTYNITNKLVLIFI